MSEGISIPGVSDKYKTNDLVNSLMAVERKPLEREKENLEKYTAQQGAWRDVNQKMSTLRDSVKTLYSFENPFNNKLTSSTQEAAVTADAGREADFNSFQIDVLNPATADRFLSANIDKEMKVPAGNYNFKVGEKTIKFNWKGGKLSDWVNSLNKRGGQYIKASLIGVSKSQQSLLIESLKTGSENKLVFEDAAYEFAKSSGMIEPVQSEQINFDSTVTAYSTPETKDTIIQQNLPLISKDKVSVSEGKIKLPPRSGVTVKLPVNAKKETVKVEFTVSENDISDITEELNSKATGPILPSPGGIEFKGVSVYNNPQETLFSAPDPSTIIPVQPVRNNDLVYVKNADGSEEPVEYTLFEKIAETGERKVVISLKDFPNAESLVFRNSNTGKNYSVSVPSAYDVSDALGYKAVHPITNAEDATFKYEGITLTRPTNDIDDVVPHITLHLHDKTEKTATIKVEPDIESAKDALITFVGKYNQTIAEMNILYQNKPELISELDYLTDSEIEKETEKLGMFFGDTTISNGKNSLQQIIANNYRYSENDEITLLSQIGISTNASSGISAGYNAAQMRGYLEIDEKKLDSALENNLNDIKQLFGFDTDGDLIIDNGIGYKLDKQLTAWVQSGGILSTKTSALDRSIKSSNQKISKLEDQLDKKEQELKRKYASMEGTLNSLESQKTTINNFANQNNNNNR